MSEPVDRDRMWQNCAGPSGKSPTAEQAEAVTTQQQQSSTSMRKRQAGPTASGPNGGEGYQIDQSNETGVASAERFSSCNNNNNSDNNDDGDNSTNLVVTQQPSNGFDQPRKRQQHEQVQSSQAALAYQQQQELQLEKSNSQHQISRASGGELSCTVTGDQQDPYPQYAPVTFFYLKQTSVPRNWCLTIVSNKYPIQSYNTLTWCRPNSLTQIPSPIGCSRNGL